MLSVRAQGDARTSWDCATGPRTQVAPADNPLQYCCVAAWTRYPPGRLCDTRLCV